MRFERSRGRCTWKMHSFLSGGDTIEFSSSTAVVCEESRVVREKALCFLMHWVGATRRAIFFFAQHMLTAGKHVAHKRPLDEKKSGYKLSKLPLESDPAENAEGRKLISFILRQRYIPPKSRHVVMHWV